VAVNCAGLPDGLIESELFGHRRGAFTGAVGDRRGLFDVADGGTLFLDEVGEATPALQGKLLRVLEEHAVRPVGGSHTHPVDVRVVGATNRALDHEVAAGRFRQDLYYRLSVFPVRVPPLRERPEDIPTLIWHFMRRLTRELGTPAATISDEALARLAAYSFPGNVRELANEVERAVILAGPAGVVTEDLLSDRVRTAGGHEGEGGDIAARLATFERAQIEAALARAGFVKTRAAEHLGITYRGLLKKMRRLAMSHQIAHGGQ
jgi:transcriptional regulator with GAF, ATPase, and Fis domain